ncbi:MAG: TonB-dependent receptor [Ignavibacteriaceae bacterium]|nr:TonB-dependent receptor [Ignavibacteriaceae bacterium]
MRKDIYKALKMFAYYSIKGFLLQVFFVNLLFGMVSTDAQKLDKIRISLDINKVTLQEALHDIEQKANLNFIYNSDEIPLDNVVSLNFDEATIEEILTKLSGDLGLSFSQLDKFIVIKKMNFPKKVPDDNAKGGIRGCIKGSDTKSALPFAIIMVEGTNNGTTSDIDGNFVLRNIKPGKHQVSVSYVGYKTKSIDVVIKSDQVIEINVVLEITSVEGQEVVVTAQRAGQQKAINDQIQSNVIKNVVAADRLQENPDANSAEAIGRLPGISLIRSGGEGTGVVIRGFNPSYSKITLDGIELPTSNISGISQYDLKGVEVFKSITPDMEGDAVAGVINLKLNQAPSGLKYSVMAQGGYNDLNNYWKNYKFVGDFSNRFFDDKLGIIVNLDVESVNRSDQTLSAGYEIKSNAPTGQLAPLYVDNINLNDEKRINQRTGGSLVLDYVLSPITKLSFSNFFSHTDQDYTDVTKSYNAANGSISYSINDVPHVKSDLYAGNLKATHQFESFELDEGLSFSQSHSYTPDSRNWYFSYNGIGLTNFGNQTIQRAQLNQILAGATDGLSDATLDKFYLYTMGRSANDALEDNINSYINSKIPFDFGQSVSGYLKFGAEYKVIQHNQNEDSRSMPVGGLQVWGNYAIPNFPWAHESGTNSLSMYGLNDGSVNNFLNGQYNFGWYPNIDRLNNIFNWWNNFSNYYIYQNPAATPNPFKGGYIGFIPDWVSITQNLQKVNQYYYAGYLMSEINLGDIASFIPGVRYEKVRDNLGGWFILPTTSSSETSQEYKPGYSTYAVKNNEYWLPMAHLKIKPLSWLQTQLSFTQTLHRPDLSQIVPYVYVNTSTASGPSSYTAGNPDLKPELWTNYDAQVVLYGDKIGLVSFTGFYKKVKDAIWTPSIYRISGEPWPYENFNIGKYYTDNTTVLITIPQNHTFPDYLKGIEFETQTNFWYLPFPFNNLSLDLNFTLINSETKYQYSKVYNKGYDAHGRPIPASVDSIYSGPMLNQPKSIVNLSIGYNYLGFNLWLSYQYTDGMITTEPNQTEFENRVAKLARWDLQVTQKLPIPGLELLLNYANINNPIGYQNYLADSRPTYSESYGWTIDFGCRYRF